MEFIQKIINPIHNCENTAIELCKAMNVGITRTSLIKEITEHPDYPSILSISDTLALNGIENIALKTSIDELSLLSLPFIIQVQFADTKDFFFSTIYSITKNNVEWLNPKTLKKEMIPTSELKALHTGIVLIVEPTEKAGETDYENKRGEERTNSFFQTCCVLFIPIVALFMIVYTAITNDTNHTLYPMLYIILTLCGAIAGIILSVYEIDQFNPILQKVCSIGKHTNCAAILHSPGAKIGRIHWSVIGVAYFMGILLTLLTSGLTSDEILGGVAWLSVLVLPYTIYSVYYQGIVAKQWCPLCLTVQIVLILQFLTAATGNFFIDINRLTIISIVPYIVLIAFSFLAMYSFVVALQKNGTAKHHFKDLQRIKLNPQIFEAILDKQKQLLESTQGLGITLGNPEGKWHIITVCNPYCQPCATAHAILDSLLNDNEELSLQLIFTATGEQTDERNKPVKLLLALQESQQDIRQALASWFSDENTSYGEFARKYSFNDDILDAQIKKIKIMNEWCNKTQIAFTPTIFINNHQLPDLYTITDLRYLLSV